MSDPKDSRQDEHIEDLLSQLQGIFGKLSHSEEEETKPKPPEAPEAPAPILEAAPAQATPAAPKSEPPRSAPADQAAAPAFESSVPIVPDDKSLIQAAVYFPPGREAEAKSLAQKLETMAPKFTKVAFRLRVSLFLPYDPKGDWKDAVAAKAGGAALQAVFFLIEKTIEDAKRKALVAELDARNIYFQEVPFASVEKKAFYTDVLLGMVFFFDSRKPPSGEA